MSLTQRQATVNPYLHQRLRDTHRQVWLSHIGISAPFSWVLVHTKVLLWPPSIYFPGDSRSFYRIPRLGNLLWALEFLHQCENFISVIVLQFVGCLLSGSIGGLKVPSARRTYPTSCTSLVCCNQSLCPHGRSVLAHASVGNTHAGLPLSLVGVTAPFPWSWCAQGFVLCTEAPILWPLNAKSQLIRKDPDAGKDCRQEEKGMTEDQMIGWHH